MAVAYGALSPKKKAVGGYVSYSQPYIVGEKGPELFVPQSSGSIVSNDKMGSSGIIVNMVNNTNASSQKIADDVGWAIRTSSDVQYRTGSNF